MMRFLVRLLTPWCWHKWIEFEQKHVKREVCILCGKGRDKKKSLWLRIQEVARELDALEHNERR